MQQLTNWTEAGEGIQRRVLHAEGQMMAIEIILNQGSQGAIHQHPHEQMTYCMKGRLKYTLEGKEVEISSGQLLYVPSQVPHGVIAVEDSHVIETFTPIREDLL